MFKAKYITWQQPTCNPTGIIFSNEFDHVRIAENMNISPNWILGAGLCTMEGDVLCVTGESMTLGKKSRKIEDRQILASFLLAD